MSAIFINYRQSDTADMANVLAERLADAFGAGMVFRDDRAISSGADFRDVIWQRVVRSRVMLVLIGRHWFGTNESGRRYLDHSEDFVRREIAEALRRDIHVIPVLIGGAHRLHEADLPEDIKALAYRQYVHVRDRSALTDIEELIYQLRKSIATPTATGDDRQTQLTIENSGAVAFGDHSSVVSDRADDNRSTTNMTGQQPPGPEFPTER